MNDSKIKNIVEGFWQYLKKGDNLNLLPEILVELTHRMNAEGTLAIVFSSSVLSKKQEEKVIKIINSKFGIEHVQFKVDEELIGGIKVKIGDEVLDLSLQNKLNDLTKAL